MAVFRSRGEKDKILFPFSVQKRCCEEGMNLTDTFLVKTPNSNFKSKEFLLLQNSILIWYYELQQRKIMLQFYFREVFWPTVSYRQEQEFSALYYISAA